MESLPGCPTQLTHLKAWGAGFSVAAITPSGNALRSGVLQLVEHFLGQRAEPRASMRHWAIYIIEFSARFAINHRCFPCAEKILLPILSPWPGALSSTTAHSKAGWAKDDTARQRGRGFELRAWTWAPSHTQLARCQISIAYPDPSSFCLGRANLLPVLVCPPRRFLVLLCSQDSLEPNLIPGLTLLQAQMPCM